MLKYIVLIGISPLFEHVLAQTIVLMMLQLLAFYYNLINHPHIHSLMLLSCTMATWKFHDQTSIQVAYVTHLTLLENVIIVCTGSAIIAAKSPYASISCWSYMWKPISYWLSESRVFKYNSPMCQSHTASYATGKCISCRKCGVDRGVVMLNGPSLSW